MHPSWEQNKLWETKYYKEVAEIPDQIYSGLLYTTANLLLPVA